MAERFFTNAEASFKHLAQQPRMGAPLTLTHPELANMRKWQVKDFGNHLGFYQPRLTVCPSSGCYTRQAIGGAYSA